MTVESAIIWTDDEDEATVTKSGGLLGDDFFDEIDRNDLPEPEPDTSTGRILSQDEIDSLMGFDIVDEVEAPTISGIEALIESSQVSYERLPMLEIVFDRMVRLMTTSMRALTAGSVEVDIGSIQSVRFSDYAEQIPVPTIISVFRAREWENSALFTLDSDLIYALVDILLGGRRGGRTVDIDGRPFTTLERRLVERLVHLTLNDLKEAFAPLTQVSFDLERTESNPRFAAIDRPSNAAVLVQLKVDFERRGGTIDLLFPYSTLEPIRDLLVQAYMGEKFGRDSIWEKHLATEIRSTSLDLQAVVGEQSVPISTINNLEVGQTLMFPATPDQSVLLRSGGIPLATGRMAQSRGSVAMHVEKVESRIRDAGQ